MMTSEIVAHHSLLCCLIAILRLVDIWTLCQNSEFQVKCDQISSCIDKSGWMYSTSDQKLSIVQLLL